MKYVLIVVVALLMARADLFLGVFDRLMERSEPVSLDTNASGIKPKELISVAEDRNLKQTPRQTFLVLLEDFHSNPAPQIHDRAIAIFKDNPTMFNQILDSELEAQIFRWRDLLNNNDSETSKFMLNLMNILQGENLEMMKRFFSFWMDINMDHFIAAYSKTKDSNCSIATTFPYAIPEKERLHEFLERQDALKAFIAKDKIETAQKNLATNCLMVLELEIAKLPPQPFPENVDPENNKVESTPEMPLETTGVSP
jgi:hypothetical protein